jgi:hypothetical protein
MEETRALCAELLSAGVSRKSRPVPPGGNLRITPTLRDAAARLDEARDALAHALRLAESEQK